jgi:cation transport ATPase
VSTAYVAIDGRIEGALILHDPIRADTPAALRTLRAAGITRIVVLSGDRKDVAHAVGNELGVDEVFSERTPADKVQAVLDERKRAVTVMVGDGINDAPALAAADVGIAMGSRGSSASSEAADAVIVLDRLDRVTDAILIARRARSIAVQSVIAGMALSAAGMLLATAGLLPPVAGAIFQEAIDAAVVLNALRALGGGLPAVQETSRPGRPISPVPRHPRSRSWTWRRFDGLDRAHAEEGRGGGSGLVPDQSLLSVAAGSRKAFSSSPLTS